MLFAFFAKPYNLGIMTIINEKRSILFGSILFIFSGIYTAYSAIQADFLTEIFVLGIIFTLLFYTVFGVVIYFTKNPQYKLNAEKITLFRNSIRQQVLPYPYGFFISMLFYEQIFKMFLSGDVMIFISMTVMLLGALATACLLYTVLIETPFLFPYFRRKELLVINFDREYTDFNTFIRPIKISFLTLTYFIAYIGVFYPIIILLSYIPSSVPDIIIELFIVSIAVTMFYFFAKLHVFLSRMIKLVLDKLTHVNN